MKLCTRPTLLALLSVLPLAAAELPTTPVYGVLDIPFSGPTCGPTDQTTRLTDFYADIRHESGSPTYRLHGYWDGDGAGGSSGNRFVIRFCPTQAGRWNLVNVYSNRAELTGEHQGDYVVATASTAKGFWYADTDSAGGRWFRRSNGSRQFIVGNTYYNFTFKPNGKATDATKIAGDVHDLKTVGMNKVRFGLAGPQATDADPTMKPFFDATGALTDTQTERMNPAYFSQRVDAAVKMGLQDDVITDLILAFGNQQYIADDYYLKYVMARYGAFPNVWFCEANEYNEQTSAAQQIQKGNLMRTYLAYPTPISTHATRGWSSTLNGAWHSHTIRQGKLPSHLPDLGACADAIVTDWNAGGHKPGINDENGYDPNESTELDVLEGILGSFAGGGYGSNGHKTASKQGGYFWGYRSQGWTIATHPSADNLGWMRARIEQHLRFWEMSPKGGAAASIFTGAPAGFRVLASDGTQYMLATNAAATGIVAALPSGTWEVRSCDVVTKSDVQLAAAASGSFSFNTPNSRASMIIFKSLAVLPPPPAPLSLGATPATTTVALAWPDPTTDESGFEVQRDTGGVWTTIASLAANTLAYSDSGLTPATAYGYRVRTLRQGLVSAWTATTTQTLAAAGPIITGPVDGTQVHPLQSVTFTGSGTSLTWTASLAGTTLASGSGSTYTVQLPASASNGQTLTVTLSGTGGSDPNTYPILDLVPVVSTVTADITPGQVGVLYSDDIEAVGGEAPYTWTMVQSGTNPLPPGLNIGAGGSLNGTPTTAGAFTFIARVTDADGDTAEKELVVIIAAALAQPVAPTIGGTATVPVLSGTTTVVGARVRILVDGVVVDTVVVDNLGAWTYTLVTTPGTHQVAIQIIDALGNSSAASTSIPVTVASASGGAGGNATVVEGGGSGGCGFGGLTSLLLGCGLFITSLARAGTRSNVNVNVILLVLLMPMVLAVTKRAENMHLGTNLGDNGSVPSFLNLAFGNT